MTTQQLPAVLRWMDSPSTAKGLSFADPGNDTWTEVRYDQLMHAAMAAASQLRDAGVRTGDVVILGMPTGPTFVANLLGAWWSGATVAPIATPLPFQSMRRYSDRTEALLSISNARTIITSDRLLEPMQAVGQACSIPVIAGQFDDASTVQLDPQAAADLAILQFTSGSSGTPRATKITWRNLESNIQAITTWLGVTETSVGATWLPLYHDMGITGGMMVAIVNQADMFLMAPEEFIRAPLRWIECYGRRGATISQAPTFGYDYVTKRITPDELEGMDFSGWDVAAVGAERVDPYVLGRFVEFLRPFGLSPRSIRPAYGLAEATVCVTAHDGQQPPPVVLPDWEVLERDGVFTPLAEGRLTEIEPSGPGWLVGNGGAAGDYTVEIVDIDHRVLDEGRVGEVTVTGDAVAAGILGDASGTNTRFDEGKLFTGDAGFVWKGSLYLLGRIGDSLKIRGKIVYAEMLEERVAVACNLEHREVVVVLGVREGKDVAAVIADVPDTGWSPTAVQTLRTETASDVVIEIYCGQRRSILRTTSGKPRRRVIWELIRSRTFPVELVRSDPTIE